MPLDHLSLGIPGNTTTNFAAAPIPMVPLFRSAPEAPLVSRSELGYSVLSGRSNRGVAQISGPASRITYLWAVATKLTKSEKRRVGKLAKWQDWGYKGITNAGVATARQARPLRLIDETEELDGEPSPHSRTLLSNLPDPDDASWVYGYGIFEVKIELPEDWWLQDGLWARGEEARLCTFSLVEL